MFEVIELGGMKTVSTKSACNHVYVVDVSGSMYHDLPKMRQHLKNIVSMVAQPEDTFSVIYFSGKGQCGVVFENVLVSDVSTVTTMHQAIDRFIKPIGLTGFVDPIRKSLELNLDKSKINNFIMLTDGYDNQSSRQDIIKNVAELSTVYQSVSFIEYGYYADRDLIGEMARATNGLHIFAEGVWNYEKAFEDVVRGVSRVNNIEVNVNKRAKHSIYLHNDQIKIAPVVDGVVSVPEDVERVHSIVPGDVLSKQLSEEHLYMVLYYAAKTTNSELVWKCLQALGDVHIVEKYQNAFTKQELSLFEEEVHAAVLDKSSRYKNGKDLNAVPNKNAPTIIDLLQSLSGSDSFLVTDSPYWKYNKIGRSGKAKEELPRFVQSPMSRVSMRSLTFNSSRPNVSVMTTINGVVELPENSFGLSKVPSHITRNYTIIKDGIRNMDNLPVLFPSVLKVEVEHFAHEVIEETADNCYWVFDLSKIPVINRSMVEKINLERFVDVVRKVESCKAAIKVLNHLIKENGGSTAKISGLIDKYGEGAAKWLSDIGVRDYGFSPVGVKSEESTDEYESIQVEYKIKGLSSLPAIDAVRKKVTEGKKLNLADSLIKTNIDLNEKSSNHEELKNQLNKVKRDGEAELANEIYTLVLGRKWYSDDEVVVTEIEFPGQPAAQLTIEKVRKMVKI